SSTPLAARNGGAVEIGDLELELRCRARRGLLGTSGWQAREVCWSSPRTRRAHAQLRLQVIPEITDLVIAAARIHGQRSLENRLQPVGRVKAERTRRGAQRFIDGRSHDRVRVAFQRRLARQQLDQSQGQTPYVGPRARLPEALR